MEERACPNWKKCAAAAWQPSTLKGGAWRAYSRRFQVAYRLQLLLR